MMTLNQKNEAKPWYQMFHHTAVSQAALCLSHLLSFTLCRRGTEINKHNIFITLIPNKIY